MHSACMNDTLLLTLNSLQNQTAASGVLRTDCTLDVGSTYTVQTDC